LRSLPARIASVSRAVAHRDAATSLSRGEYTNVIFLHHSTGNLLIKQGRVRALMAEAGYDFWDQGYNGFGLKDPAGVRSGYGYFVYHDNTDPDGLARLLAEPAYDLPLNALSGLLQHEVIVLKSCFLPANDIPSDQHLAALRRQYLAMRTSMAEHPDKLFILLTTPPVNPAETSQAAAHRARQLADWLTSAEFLQGWPNLVVFDLYSHLAEDDPGSPEYGMLRGDYREGADSHPNRTANETIGPVLAAFMIDAIEAYRLSRAPVGSVGAE
jgi:hypothetical protein